MSRPEYYDERVTHDSSPPPPPSSLINAHPETADASPDVSTLNSAPSDRISHHPLPQPHSRNVRNLSLDHSAVRSPPSRPIRRKPLSSTASPVATRYSTAEHLVRKPSLASVVAQEEEDLSEPRFPRSFSVDSPTLYDFPRVPTHQTPPVPPEAQQSSQGLASPQTNKGLPPLNVLPHSSHTSTSSASAAKPTFQHTSEGPQPPAPLPGSMNVSSHHVEHSTYDDLLASDNEDPLSSDDDVLAGYNTGSPHNSNPHSPNSTMSLHVNRKPIPPHLTLDATSAPTDNTTLQTPSTDKPLPKSPGSSKLGNFFGWGSPSTAADSDKGFSPLPSPYNGKSSTASDALTPGQSSLLGPNGHTTSDYTEGSLNTPPAGLSPAAQIDEMEDELKAISVELAASIRREMDLEDLVDRMQAEKDNPTSTANKRTSDYFSDSGYSSAKVSDYDQSREEIEKIQRRSEQEKAQIRLELTNKLQDERSRRTELDGQIKHLSERASQVDLAKINNVDTSDRVRELESTCETLRRKLTEERKVKDNFEDLLTALRTELLDAANDRDNLRDEIVPQLRARVEGLEAQATDMEQMTYESTKMQQELQDLKLENNSLRGSGMSRSNSVTGVAKFQRRESGLSRSKTVKGNESREQLSDRLKDVEEQRDALHRALKSLLDRQEFQNRENDKKIKFLEMERDRLLSAPGSTTFQRDVSKLRSEINVLRRRADEAQEQKWQVEKGLAGLKMDLDRAEQEITSLKSLLLEKDILIPPSLARSSQGSDPGAAPVSSESLTNAYQELQRAYSESLERITKLEGATTQDEKTKLAIERLEQSVSIAVDERDAARKDNAFYQEQLDALKASEQTYLDSEKAFADELSESARRVEELAVQVRQQLSTNQNLRQRISDTVLNREAEQRANKERITGMMDRLRYLEEKLEAAQAASEDRVAQHDEEMTALKENHRDQLTRLKKRDAPSSPRTFSGKSDVTDLFGNREPRLSETRSGPAMTVKDETQIDNLRARIAELENALTDADYEMEKVVGRMNSAQIDVLTLQEEREAAVNQTRKLERALEAEKVKAFEDRFATMKA